MNIHNTWWSNAIQRRWYATRSDATRSEARQSDGDVRAWLAYVRCPHRSLIYVAVNTISIKHVFHTWTFGRWMVNDEGRVVCSHEARYKFLRVLPLVRNAARCRIRSLRINYRRDSACDNESYLPSAKRRLQPTFFFRGLTPRSAIIRLELRGSWLGEKFSYTSRYEGLFELKHLVSVLDKDLSLPKKGTLVHHRFSQKCNYVNSFDRGSWFSDANTPNFLWRSTKTFVKSFSGRDDCSKDLIRGRR